MIVTPTAKIFYAGDTGYGKHFKVIYEEFGPMDVCLLPIGAYEPRWFMQEAHLSPSEAVTAHQDLGCRQSLGVHFGTFQISDEAHDQPVLGLQAALETKRLDPASFRTLAPGQYLDVISRH